MSITIESSRFGALELAPDSLLEFPEGLIGIAGTRYALLAREADSAFLWLQSVDDPAFSLPVVNPHRFFADYEIHVSDADAARARLDGEKDVQVYVTVRAADAIEEFTVNLRAPILICGQKGFQVINEADHAPLRTPLLGELAAPREEAA